MTARATNSITPKLRSLWNLQEKFGRDLAGKMAGEGRAIVSHEELPKDGWKMEEVTVRKPGKGELLVEMVASGV